VDIPRAALAMAALAGLGACRTSYDFVPTTSADVRAGMAEMKEGTGTIRDARGGAHRADGATMLRVRETELSVSDLMYQCVPGRPCPLDDPHATFEIGKPKKVFAPDVFALYLVSAAALGGLVYGHVACLSAEGCSTFAAVTVVTVDVLLVLGLVATLAAASSWSKFRGD
jgi:hypothetical protein